MKQKVKIIGHWIKAHLWIFKLIFITSIMFFVVNQLTNILQGMTWHKFVSLVLKQGFPSIIAMLLIGLICVLPMILYDVATVQTLKIKREPKMLFLDSWVINTINNLVGFGGVVGVTLRMNRYGKEKKGAQTLATITKTAFFMLTGLSILCFVMLIFLNVSPIASVYRHYQLWLFIGSFFAPCLLLFIRWKKELFKEFHPKQLALFYLASLGQWLGAMGIFLFIGHQMVPQLLIIKIAPLFIAATLIGMITMVPGGMGTFDVLMILGLANVGVNKEVAIVWLLFYRIFYYLIPFISGCAIFINQTGNKVDHALNHLPSTFCHKVLRYIATFSLYVMGIMMIIMATMPNLSLFYRFFKMIFSFTIPFVDQSINIMIGLLLIGLARGVHQRIKKAYRITWIVLLFCLINTIFIAHSWQLSFLFLLTLICLYLSRREFTREGMAYSWGSILIDFIIFIGVAIFYGLVGYFVNTRHQFNSTNFILFPSETIWFRGLLGLIAAAMILIVLYYYFSRGRQIGEPFDAKRYQKMIDRYGDNRYHHLGFGGDYYCYYYREDKEDCVCFLFKKIANHCVVLGTPLGKEASLKSAVEAFKNDLVKMNYQAIFYSIDHHFSVLLHDFGYEFMKIGEEGYHDVDQHIDQASAQTKWLTDEEKTQYFPDCQTISYDFEALHRPLYFNRARFSKALYDYSEVLVYEVDGKILAYAVLSQENKKSIDLLYLHYSELQSVKPFIHDIQSLCEQRTLSLSLGISPLYNVGTSMFAFTEEKLINIVYHFGETASQLEKMTQAMSPYVNRWENRYMSYPRKQSFTVLILQISLLMLKKIKRNK